MNTTCVKIYEYNRNSKVKLLIHHLKHLIFCVVRSGFWYSPLLLTQWVFLEKSTYLHSNSFFFFSPEKMGQTLDFMQFSLVSLVNEFVTYVLTTTFPSSSPAPCHAHQHTLISVSVLFPSFSLSFGASSSLHFSSALSFFFSLFSCPILICYLLSCSSSYL